MVTKILILIPLMGYAGLWIMGSLIFLIYFKLFKIPIDLKHTVAMIQKIPTLLAIITPLLCSFISFFITTRVILKILSTSLDAIQLLQIGLISLLLTIGLDLLITVVGEKIDMSAFPVNLMYLFAWLAIVPAVILASY